MPALIDGYTSQQDWHNKHKGLIPAAGIYQYTYTVPYNDELVSYPPKDREYSPRPSLVRKLNMEMKYDSMIEKFGINGRERTVMDCLFDENLTQDETSERLGISQSLVSIIRSRVIKKMKKKVD